MTNTKQVDAILASHHAGSLDRGHTIDAGSIVIIVGTPCGQPSARDPFAAENHKARRLLGADVSAPYSAKAMRAVLASMR